jgi:8-oxo-dGTP pyrophosphatase MutT (NUDIX family)
MPTTATRTTRSPKRRPAKEHGRFQRREDGPPRLEVHVAGICYRRSNGGFEILAARRTKDRRLFPKKWEFGGGTVQPTETFESAIKRQIFEELGLQVRPMQVMEVYEIPIRGPQRLIPGVRFICEAKAGRVRLNRREFSTYRWLKVPVRAKLDWISGLKEVVDSVSRMLVQASQEGAKRPARTIGFRSP